MITILSQAGSISITIPFDLTVFSSPSRPMPILPQMLILQVLSWFYILWVFLLYLQKTFPCVHSIFEVSLLFRRRACLLSCYFIIIFFIYACFICFTVVLFLRITRTTIHPFFCLHFLLLSFNLPSTSFFFSLSLGWSRSLVLLEILLLVIYLNS